MRKLLKLLGYIRKQHDGVKSIDTVLVICGKERIGKSNLGLHILEQWQEDSNIKQVSLNSRDFITALADGKKNDCIIHDEAGDGLFGRDYNKEINKDLVKTFFIIGARQYLTILCVPDFWQLDKSFREHRAKGVFVVHKTGNFRFYGRKKLDKIVKKFNDWGKKGFPINECSFHDSYPKYSGKLLKDYTAKKGNKIQEYLGELKGKYKQSKPDISLGQFSRKHQVHPDSVKKVAKQHNIEIKKNLTGKKSLIDEKTEESLVEALKTLRKYVRTPILA